MLARVNQGGVAAAVLVAVAAIARGLFPPLYGLVFAAVALAGLVVVTLWQRPKAPASWLEVGVLALVATAWIAVPGAAAIDQAVQGAVIMAGVGAAYLGLRAILGTGAGMNARRFFQTVSGATVVVALVGLVCMAGHPIHGWLDANGRLAGPLQYPNATAAFLGLGWMLLPESLPRHWGRIWRGAALYGGLGALGGAVLFTGSREGLGILAAAGTAWALTRPAPERWGALWMEIAGAILATLVYTGMGSHADPARLIGPLVVAAGAGAAGVALWGRLDGGRTRALLGGAVGALAVLALLGLGVRGTSLAGKTWAVPVAGRTAVVSVVGGAGTVLAVPGTATAPGTGAFYAGGVHRTVTVPLSGNERDVWISVSGAGARPVIEVDGKPAVPFLARLLPAGLYSRIGTVSASSFDWWERTVMWRNALTLLAQRPWRGFGEGGWAAAYESVQSFGYFSAQAHSWLMETAVNTGLPGVAAILLTVIGMALAWRRARAATIGSRNLVDAAAAGAAFMLVHALMDWDFSYPALILLWLGVGAAWRAYMPAAEGERSPIVTRVPGAVLFAAGLAAAVVLGVGSWWGDKAITAIHADQGIAAYNDALAQVRWDPLSAGGLYEMGELSQQMYLTPRIAKANTLKDLQAAVRLAPYDFTFEERLGEAFLYYRDIPQGIQAFEAAARLAPRQTTVYQGLEEGLNAAGIIEANMGARAAAKGYFLATLAAHKKAVLEATRQPGVTPAQWRLNPHDAVLAYNVGLADIMLHHDKAAAAIMPPMPRKSTDLSVSDLAGLIAADVYLHVPPQKAAEALAATPKTVTGVTADYKWLIQHAGPTRA